MVNNRSGSGWVGNGSGRLPPSQIAWAAVSAVRFDNFAMTSEIRGDVCSRCGVVGHLRQRKTPLLEGCHRGCDVLMPVRMKNQKSGEDLTTHIYYPIKEDDKRP